MHRWLGGGEDSAGDGVDAYQELRAKRTGGRWLTCGRVVAMRRSAGRQMLLLLLLLLRLRLRLLLLLIVRTWLLSEQSFSSLGTLARAGIEL